MKNYEMNEVKNTSEELEVLKEVAERLDKCGVRYMISGSIAMNFYAQPRMTRDIDIVIVLQDRGIEEFVSLFEKDFYLEKDTVREEVRRHGMFNAIHNKYIIKIDFIVQKDSEYDAHAFTRRRKIEVDGAEIWIVSPEDLVLAKLRWAGETLSEMQIKDVRNILSSVDSIDEEYIRRWVNMLKLAEIFEKAKS